jgi:hypothetical protein
MTAAMWAAIWLACKIGLCWSALAALVYWPVRWMMILNGLDERRWQ